MHRRRLGEELRRVALGGGHQEVGRVREEPIRGLRRLGQPDQGHCEGGLECFSAELEPSKKNDFDGMRENISTAIDKLSRLLEEADELYAAVKVVVRRSVESKKSIDNHIRHPFPRL